MYTWEKEGIKESDLKKYPYRVFNWNKWSAKYYKTLQEAKNNCSNTYERVEELKITKLNNGLISHGYEIIKGVNNNEIN